MPFKQTATKAHAVVNEIQLLGGGKAHVTFV